MLKSTDIFFSVSVPVFDPWAYSGHLLLDNIFKKNNTTKI